MNLRNNFPSPNKLYLWHQSLLELPILTTVKDLFALTPNSTVAMAAPNSKMMRSHELDHHASPLVIDTSTAVYDGSRDEPPSPPPQPPPSPAGWNRLLSVCCVAINADYQVLTPRQARLPCAIKHLNSGVHDSNASKSAVLRTIAVC